VEGLGFLDPSSESSAWQKEAKVELPLWLADSLFRRARMANRLEVSAPEAFSHNMRQGQMRADPIALNLPR